jgi:hypothetical protein
VIRNRLLLSSALALAVLFGLLAALLLQPDRRSAWDQASLTRDLPEENLPAGPGLWSDQLLPLLREADALGSEPAEPAARQAWLRGQCAINQRIQALQRQYGRPVESAERMGRPPACERLAPL